MPPAATPLSLSDTFILKVLMERHLSLENIYLKEERKKFRLILKTLQLQHIFAVKKTNKTKQKTGYAWKVAKIQTREVN